MIRKANASAAAPKMLRRIIALSLRENLNVPRSTETLVRGYGLSSMCCLAKADAQSDQGWNQKGKLR